MSYKIPIGLPQDPKLTVIARAAQVKRGVALGVWVALLDHAARAKPRGSLAAAAPDEIAATLECSATEVAAVIAALRDKKMITAEQSVAHWQRYQKLSTPRVRAHRAQNRIDAHRAQNRIDAHRAQKENAAAPETDATRRDRLQKEMNRRRGKSDKPQAVLM